MTAFDCSVSLPPKSSFFTVRENYIRPRLKNTQRGEGKHRCCPWVVHYVPCCSKEPLPPNNRLFRADEDMAEVVFTRKWAPSYLFDMELKQRSHLKLGMWRFKWQQRVLWGRLVEKSCFLGTEISTRFFFWGRWGEEEGKKKSRGEVSGRKFHRLMPPPRFFCT